MVVWRVVWGLKWEKGRVVLAIRSAIWKLHPCIFVLEPYWLLCDFCFRFVVILYIGTCGMSLSPHKQQYYLRVAALRAVWDHKGARVNESGRIPSTNPKTCTGLLELIYVGACPKCVTKLLQQRLNFGFVPKCSCRWLLVSTNFHFILLNLKLGEFGPRSKPLRLNFYLIAYQHPFQTNLRNVWLGRLKITGITEFFIVILFNTYTTLI